MTVPEDCLDRGPDDPLYSDDYYTFLEQQFGPERAAWARLPRRTRGGTHLDPRELRDS